MARFSGAVGYGNSVETPPNSGKWVDVVTEQVSFGDLVRLTRDIESSDKVNKDISIGNSVSIVADQYAIEHFSKIRYVVLAGVRWTVTTVEVRAPRLILTLGSVYNGPTP
jgi:hypothetical protein